jgi:hypothetical protein
MNPRIISSALELVFLLGLCHTGMLAQRNTGNNVLKKPASTKKAAGEKQPNIPPKNVPTAEINQTKTTQSLLNYNYFPKGGLFANDPPKLLIRTLAYRLNLSARGVLIPKLKVNIFLEAKLERDDFEKRSDGSFIVKKEPEFFFVHIINRSDPNLTFDSKKERLLWFDVGNSRWVLGSLDQRAIADFDIHQSSSAPLETLADMLARGDEVSELLTIMVLTKELSKLTGSERITGHLGEFQFQFNQSVLEAIKAFSNGIKPVN